jgi:hypothetical protein
MYFNKNGMGSYYIVLKINSNLSTGINATVYQICADLYLNGFSYSYSVQMCVILTFILLMWTFGRAPTNACKWEMGFNFVA